MTRLPNRAYTAATERDCRVLALGSPHGDDRAPWLVADRLAESAQVGVTVWKLASPFEVLNHVNGNTDLIVIDVCVSGAPPGTVLRFDETRLATFSPGVRASHGGSLGESLQLALALERRPRSLCVLAVEMIPSDAGVEKSEVSKHCVEPLWKQLLIELSKIERLVNRL